MSKRKLPSDSPVLKRQKANVCLPRFIPSPIEWSSNRKPDPSNVLKPFALKSAHKLAKTVVRRVNVIIPSLHFGGFYLFKEKTSVSMRDLVQDVCSRLPSAAEAELLGGSVEISGPSCPIFMGMCLVNTVQRAQLGKILELHLFDLENSELYLSFQPCK
jgi:hypothetical protein